MSLLGLVLPLWISGPAKAIGGALRLIPWPVWALVAVLAAVAYYGHVREERGDATGAARQLAADQVTIKALTTRIALMRAANERAAELDAAAHKHQAEKMATAEATLTKERDDAIATGRSLAADLRAGNQRLRLEWQGCRSAGGGGAEAGGSAESEDAAARAREKGAGDLVGDADLADAEIRYYQSLIRSAPRSFLVED